MAVLTPTPRAALWSAVPLSPLSLHGLEGLPGQGGAWALQRHHLCSQE